MDQEVDQSLKLATTDDHANTIQAMALISASGNHVKNSRHTKITNNTKIYNSSYKDNLSQWMSEHAQPVPSRKSSTPDLFAPNFTERTFRSPGFQACLTRLGRTLVLRGDLGAGKTTTIQGLIKKLRENDDAAVAFVLFECENPAGYVACKVLMHFVQQLADLTDDRHRKHLLKLSKNFSKEHPGISEAADVLTAIINTERRTKTGAQPRGFCIFLDGLDEFGDDDQLHLLLKHLVDVQARTGCGIVVTSRLETSVEQVFRDYSTSTVSADPEDVKTFVRSSRRGLAVTEVIAKNSKKADEIGKAVIEGSKGS